MIRLCIYLHYAVCIYVHYNRNNFATPVTLVDSSPSLLLEPGPTKAMAAMKAMHAMKAAKAMKAANNEDKAMTDVTEDMCDRAPV